MEVEIKNRIEQIRQGKVPAGYKKAGGEIFPGDWTTASIETLYTERKESGQEGLPVLSVSIHSGVSDKSLDKTERGKEIKRIEDKTQYKKVYPGDLIFNMMRAWQGGIGVASVQGQVSPAYIVAQPNDSIFPYYMNYYMKMPQMIGKLQRRSYGVTDFRLRLYWKSFVTIMCHFPDLREQKCIAAILETQDRVIALREKLLAEKLRQKQYLMQVLLTGKKRLPGFTGKWNYVQMKTLGTTYSGLSGKNKEDFGKGRPYIPYINIYSNAVIDTNNFDYVSIAENEKQNSVKYGDIFFTTSSETPDEVGMSSVLLEKVDNLYLNSFCFGFRLHNFLTLLPQYAVYYFRGGNFRRILDSLAQGSTRFNLSKNNLLKAMLLLPPIKEQKVIVEILRTIDREINLLKQELEQERRKKKALMQLLLSGIVRVKP